MILHIKYQGPRPYVMVSDKKNFYVFSNIAYVKHVTPGRGHFWPNLHNLNKLGRSSLDNAT